ncbi:unnamed protein product [Rotaria socialis]
MMLIFGQCPFHPHQATRNNAFDPKKRTDLPKRVLDIVLSNLSVFTTINNYEIYLKTRPASTMLLYNSFELASKTIICKSFPKTMSKCSHDQYRKETTTNNEFSLQLNNEFFGRYEDQIFFTWNNGNEEQLGSFLQTIRDQSPNVQFQKLIASSVPFLNAFVQNQHGDLFSRIYRHPLIQSYSLPYEVGHAKLVHSD